MARSQLQILAFSLLSLAPSLALAEKFAYVDLQRALEETDDGKKAKAKLKTDFERKQKELNDKQEDLKKLKEEIDKKLPLMKPEAAAAEQKKLQERFLELQNIYARLQKDLSDKEQQATAGIFQKLQAVVAQIAEREKFSMVFEKNTSVVWGQLSLDITNEVIRLYNNGKTK